MSKSAPYRRRIFGLLAARLGEGPSRLQVVSGPRQVGKTTVVRQVLGASDTPNHYASADDPALRDAAWLEAQWEEGRRLARDRGEAILAIDEIQKVSNWAETVKRLWDEDRGADRPLRVVLLGSAALPGPAGFEREPDRALRADSRPALVIWGNAGRLRLQPRPVHLLRWLPRCRQSRRRRATLGGLCSGLDRRDDGLPRPAATHQSRQAGPGRRCPGPVSIAPGGSARSGRPVPCRNRPDRAPAPRARAASRIASTVASMRHAVGRTGMAGDDLDVGVVERELEQLGGRPAVGDHHVGPHPLGLGIDVDADHARVGQAGRRADHQPGLRAGAAGAMHDGRRREARCRRLLRDLGDVEA